MNYLSRQARNKHRKRSEHRHASAGWWFGQAKQSKADAYLQRAVLLLRAFFLTKETAMNPNMMFAQGTPGLRNGTAYGTADVGRFKILLDAVRLVESDATTAATWTPADRGAFRHWTLEMLGWWTSSGCEQRLFFAAPLYILILKTIILPRQAQGKVKKEALFAGVMAVPS